MGRKNSRYNPLSKDGQVFHMIKVLFFTVMVLALSSCTAIKAGNVRDGGYIGNEYRKAMPNDFFGSLGGYRHIG